MAFQTAVSGIKAASTDLNVIGNNIANANTNGFKQSRAEFADIYAQSGIALGGNSPGIGVRTTRIAQIFNQGNVTFTDNALDLAIKGEGFFILDDNGSRVFTRAGAFGLDREGYLVNATDMRLVGFQADSSGNILGSTAAIQIPPGDISPSATTTVNLSLNLDSSSTVPVNAFSETDPTSYNNATSVTIYDSLGAPHLASLYYVKTSDNNWDSYLFVDGTQIAGPDALGFSTSGILTSPAPAIITSPSFTPSGGGAAMTLDLDYTDTTQFGSDFGVNAILQDGYTTGHLSSIDIDPKGIIFARYTNGRSEIQGQLALANFANVQGLRPIGDTNWVETFASGDPAISAAETSRLGTIQSGALEDSNVDLSEQLVKMIIAQRNFQANAEMISTEDTVTQSIINIR